MYKWGGLDQKSQNKRTKLLNSLILEHLENDFIEALNKFLRCFQINGLQNLKLTILRVFAQSPHLYILLYSSKNIFIVKAPGIHIIFIHKFWNVFFKEAIYLEFVVVALYFYGWWSGWQMRNEKREN